MIKETVDRAINKYCKGVSPSPSDDLHALTNDEIYTFGHILLEICEQLNRPFHDDEFILYDQIKTVSELYDYFKNE